MKLKIPLSILLALLGVAAAILYLVQSNQPDKLYHAVQQPPLKPHQNDIAGVGLVESRGGNTVLLPYWPGKVTRVYVQPGDHVKADAPLYKLDVTAHATIKAPFAGEVLQVNTRQGEFVSLDPRNPPVILGHTGPLQVRVDVDESQASNVRPNQPAVAYLKGDPSKHFPMRFVRIEPMMVPKTSLTGSSMERVDVRVLQLIYAFDPPSFPVYVGQQLDVYMTR